MINITGVYALDGIELHVLPSLCCFGEPVTDSTPLLK